MGGDRRAVPEPLLLIWSVVIAPIGGAAAAAMVADVVLPPFSPSWLRALVVVVAGMVGLLAGGAAGSYVPTSLAFPQQRRRPARAFVLTMAAAAVALIATGSPLPWIYTLPGALIVAMTVAWTLRGQVR
jgi:hypothetical protein